MSINNGVMKRFESTANLTADMWERWCWGDLLLPVGSPPTTSGASGAAVDLPRRKEAVQDAPAARLPVWSSASAGDSARWVID